MINLLHRTNTNSSEGEIQHIKHKDASTMKETEVEDGDCDETLYENVKKARAPDDGGSKNVYETMSDEGCRMSTCPAYGTLK